MNKAQVMPEKIKMKNKIKFVENLTSDISVRMWTNKDDYCNTPSVFPSDSLFSFYEHGPENFPNGKLFENNILLDYLAHSTFSQPIGAWVLAILFRINSKCECWWWLVGIVESSGYFWNFILVTYQTDNAIISFC